MSANIDGTNDVCSKGQDIVFTFIGYSLTGQVREREREREKGKEEIINKDESKIYVFIYTCMYIVHVKHICNV